MKKTKKAVKAYGACYKDRKVIPHTVRHLQRKVWEHLIESLYLDMDQVGAKYLSKDKKSCAMKDLKESGWSVIPVDLVWRVK